MKYSIDFYDSIHVDNEGNLIVLSNNKYYLVCGIISYSINNIVTICYYVEN